jgi:hypothetical protein
MVGRTHRLGSRRHGTMADAAQASAEAFDSAASIAYLRERGVEVELPEERAAKAATKAAASSQMEAADRVNVNIVRIPADGHTAVEDQTLAVPKMGQDVLSQLLAPRFDDSLAMDEATVARETAARLKNMVVGGADKPLHAPSADVLQEQARGGVCEAWPLAQASPDNDWRAVRLYIDEVGALRGRPRNSRAEALAAAAGLSGVAIHGDAYVGRCERGSSGEGFGEQNVDFRSTELAHDSPWVLAARRAHEQQAAAAGHGAEEHLTSGGDEGGAYKWTQGEEDIEVRVLRGIPEGGKAVKKRITVGYGRGEALLVKVDGEVVMDVPRLFDRVTPDECTWSLGTGDGGKPELVISMEKADARPWTSLELPGLSL